MKEALFGMKSVSNQKSLAQSDQELALVTVQFIQAVKKMVEGRSFNLLKTKDRLFGRLKYCDLDE
jgi:hypothetical protein